MLLLMEQKILHHLGCRKMLVLYKYQNLLGHPKWLAGFFSINTNGEFIGASRGNITTPSIGTGGVLVFVELEDLKKK